jgi:hypothetical protein
VTPSSSASLKHRASLSAAHQAIHRYLIKYAQLIGRPNDIWAPAWIKTVKASIEHLITRASGTSKQL